MVQMLRWRRLLVSLVRMREVDIGRWLGVFALRLDEPRLEMDDILAQRIVLGLDLLVALLQRVQIAHLLLELLNIPFLALTKCPLWLFERYVSLRSMVVMT